MPRNESVLKYTLRCGVLFAFCLLFIQTGYAGKQSLKWEILGELKIVKYPESIRQMENPGSQVAPSEIGMPGEVELFIEEDVVYLDAFGESIGREAFSRRLVQKEWSFVPSQRDKANNYERKEEKAPKDDASLTSITTCLNENLANALADALYENILSSLKFSDILRKYDTEYANIGGAREEKGREQYLYNGKPWKNLNETDKKECLLRWIREFCISATDGLTSEFEWQKTGNIDVAILMCDDFAEWDNGLERFPPELVPVLESLGGRPEIFFRKKILGRDVVILHTFKHHFLYCSYSESPLIFKRLGDKLLLCNGNELWTLSSNGENPQRYEIPIRPHNGTYGIMPIAFFLKDRTLYVFGQSPTDPKKTVVLKTNLNDILPTEKTDSPNP